MGGKGDVTQVVQAGKQAHFAKFGNPSQHCKADMRVLILDHAVNAFKRLAQGASGVGFVDVIENWLVVFIHQHHHALAGLFKQADDEVGEAAVVIVVTCGQAKLALVLI